VYRVMDVNKNGASIVWQTQKSKQQLPFDTKVNLGA